MRQILQHLERKQAGIFSRLFCELFLKSAILLSSERENYFLWSGAHLSLSDQHAGSHVNMGADAAVS